MFTTKISKKSQSVPRELYEKSLNDYEVSILTKKLLA